MEWEEGEKRKRDEEKGSNGGKGRKTYKGIEFVHNARFYPLFNLGLNEIAHPKN